MQLEDVPRPSGADALGNCLRLVVGDPSRNSNGLSPWRMKTYYCLILHRVSPDPDKAVAAVGFFVADLEEQMLSATA